MGGILSRPNLSKYRALSSNTTLDRDVSYTYPLQPSGAGLPTPSRTLWLSDYVVLLCSLFCFALALVSVFDSRIAMELGQVNQLIVFGVLLYLMALCTQTQAQHFLLVCECLWNESWLKNYESILRASVTTSKTTGFVRFAIFVYLGFPVGLGIAYKRFTGGWTSSDLTNSTGTYGMNGPPGTSGIGSQGVLFFINSTLPWWVDPASSGSYGFNLNVEGANRTALLDGPTPGYVSSLQGLLQEGDTLYLNSSVNATVSEMVIDLTDRTRTEDLTYWYNYSLAASLSPKTATDDFYETYLSTECVANDTGSWTWSTAFAVYVGCKDGYSWNNSFTLVSRWNVSDNQTFGTAAQEFATYRQRYHATWFITKSAISLSSASPIPHGILTDNYSVDLIQNNLLGPQWTYAKLFLEYDWKYTPTAPQHKSIKSDTTLVAAMIWSRITAYNGLGSAVYNASDDTHGVNLWYSSESIVWIERPTLQQSRALAFILAINPLVLLTLLAVRLTLLRDAPISKGFGMTSLLAAIDTDTLGLMKGVAYSGELKEDVRLEFSVSSSVDLQDFRPGLTTSPSQHGNRLTARLKRSNNARYRSTGTMADRIRMGTVYQ